jgi:molybdopterin-guanine dinucleotide biosynthesis protein A
MTIEQPKWNVVILAGQRPGGDVLARHFGEEWKALVQIDGEPMLTRVVRSVCALGNIETPIVLAQDSAALTVAAQAGGRVEMHQSGNGISTSILALADQADIWPALITTADHPLLTPEMLSYFLKNASGCDVAVGMVERGALLSAYPDNKRTWLKFRDGHWSGANLFALNSERARRALSLWAEAEQDRKKVWKLFLHFGPWLAVRALTRTIGLAEALMKAGDRLGISVRLVSLPFAEAAIDVDKPSDHALATDILMRRSKPV